MREVDWDPSHDQFLEAAYATYSSEMSDLPFIPSVLCSDYESELSRDFGDLLAGFVESDDDSDFDYSPDDDNSSDGEVECTHDPVASSSFAAAEAPRDGGGQPPSPPIQSHATQFQNFTGMVLQRFPYSNPCACPFTMAYPPFMHTAPQSFVMHLNQQPPWNQWGR